MSLWLQLCRFGPLIRLWCMQFEDHYFKVLAHSLQNFKNLPKTMASRHQHLMCYHLANQMHFSNFHPDDAVAVGEGNAIRKSSVITSE